MDKWTKKRAQNELENPENWKIDFAKQYIVELSFEFHSLRFVKYSVKTAQVDWLIKRGAYLPVAMHGYDYKDLGRFFVVMHVGDTRDTTALTEVSIAGAVEMMMDALKKEGVV
jgi:hypothetical protein